MAFAPIPKGSALPDTTLELAWGGKEPVTVKDEERTFLLDGDEVTISGTAPGPNGSRIGFGEVTGRIEAAR
jgi:fumarylacetoacetase